LRQKFGEGESEWLLALHPFLCRNLVLHRLVTLVPFRPLLKVSWTTQVLFKKLRVPSKELNSIPTSTSDQVTSTQLFLPHSSSVSFISLRISITSEKMLYSTIVFSLLMGIGNAAPVTTNTLDAAGLVTGLVTERNAQLAGVGIEPTLDIDFEDVSIPGAFDLPLATSVANGVGGFLRFRPNDRGSTV
jgi:hypothetical protein